MKIDKQRRLLEDIYALLDDGPLHCSAEDYSKWLAEAERVKAECQNWIHEMDQEAEQNELPVLNQDGTVFRPKAGVVPAFERGEIKPPRPVR